MDTTTKPETRSERLIAAFVAGDDAEMLEIRGGPLTATERAEYELEARALHGSSATETSGAIAS